MNLNDLESDALSKFLKMVVGTFNGTLRMAVDSQQTSFEERF